MQSVRLPCGCVVALAFQPGHEKGKSSFSFNLNKCRVCEHAAEMLAVLRRQSRTMQVDIDAVEELIGKIQSPELPNEGG